MTPTGERNRGCVTGVFVGVEMPLAGAGSLTRRESRILASECRAVVLPRRFALLGEPREHSVEWCQAALGRLIEEAYWAPEVDWVPGPGACVQIRFRRPENLLWAVLAAEQVGVVARDALGQRLENSAYAGSAEPGAPG